MKIRVRNGDTFWYYSQLFYIPIGLIIDSNPSLDPNGLKIGAEVEIPGFIKESYIIKQGDTFWNIANVWNINVDAILLVNENINPNSLSIGTSIHLPARVITPVVDGKQGYSYSVLEKDISRLKEIYPFMKLNSIGESVLGKPIIQMKIGNGRKKVHMDASFHANEWITTSILMTFINDYLLSLTNVKPIRGVQTLPIYNGVTLSIVPMVNPDGVDLVLKGPPNNMKDQLVKINKGSSDFTAWKANIRGVDLNNQFPAKWEVEKERKEEKEPAPRDFPGDKPLSEPETIAMAELAKEEVFDRLLALHTQGKEFYWGYEGLEPPEAERLAKDFERVSGYESVRYVDSYAGYKDWYIKEFQKSSFTLELGKGINPLPISQFDEIYRDTLGIFLVAVYRWY
ncbi:LysM peptidoglycan-binding domain-containing protein [Bacillus haikouensis]|jgi:g-D-glutamyl-meso-diaminopimelate peptidase|uniref:M14 family metallopeptidase n=1 Tax=Bacillus haikouensis TaxID=1510468 RepID=UPI001555C401|nr:M14 family metallopeptidase [Bacillus haikouensis]NQD67716.1 LysM peptidoglycan-binding domain-containing protein [Bacillus haikouensis]